MRYTKKINNGYTTEQEGINAVVPCIGKLGKLEDIEEELGIDLVKLFKVLEPNQHIWSIGNFEGVKCYVGDKYLTEYKEIIAYSGNKDNFVICHLCDYGKTWAFTKEELKNETTRNDTKRAR